MKNIIHIASQAIPPGEHTQINLNIARLPSHTVIDVPVYIYRSRVPGPVLLFTAGLHGDELNGIEIVRRLIADGLTVPVRGTVIAMPVVNIFGFLHATRDLPDGKDLNRSFPGSKTGSLARRVAYVVMREVLPAVDIGVDFHTGGAQRANYPQVRCAFDDAKSLRLAKKFDAPLTIDSKYVDKSFRKEAGKAGKRIIVYEGGESSRFDPLAIKEGIRGARRMMASLKMRNEPLSKRRTVSIRSTVWVRARSSGLLRGRVRPGVRVASREVIATITDPFGESEYHVRAPQAGWVIGVNHQPVISQGDAVLHLGFV